MVVGVLTRGHQMLGLVNKAVFNASPYVSPPLRAGALTCKWYKVLAETLSHMITNLYPSLSIVSSKQLYKQAGVNSNLWGMITSCSELRQSAIEAAQIEQTTQGFIKKVFGAVLMRFMNLLMFLPFTFNEVQFKFCSVSTGCRKYTSLPGSDSYQVKWQRITEKLQPVEYFNLTRDIVVPWAERKVNQLTAVGYLFSSIKAEKQNEVCRQSVRNFPHQLGYYME